MMTQNTPNTRASIHSNVSERNVLFLFLLYAFWAFLLVNDFSVDVSTQVRNLSIKKTYITRLQLTRDFGMFNLIICQEKNNYLK